MADKTIKSYYYHHYYSYYCYFFRDTLTLLSPLLTSKAAEEERKVRAIEEDVTIKAKISEADLRKAEPLLIAANEALNTLNKNNLTELKSFGQPPKAVVHVCAAVLVLLKTEKGRIPKDRSWRACKVCFHNIFSVCCLFSPIPFILLYLFFDSYVRVYLFRFLDFWASANDGRS